MKRYSKSISRILTAALLLTLTVSVLPLRAAADADPSGYPTVFVHGLYGWGSYDKLNSILPYWGSHTGSVITELSGEGHPCYAASVGPYSSAWDRACELYAQITGTRTDYGEAHSRRCGHDRYGRDFTGNALIPGFTWDSSHPVNFIGHSFGGIAVRQLVDLLYDGSAEEQQAAGATVSPLFTGGHRGWIHSVTTVSSPHNGSTFIDANPGATFSGPRFYFYLFQGMNLTIPGLYDPLLDQFGLVQQDGETPIDLALRIAQSDFYSHYDDAVNDMSIPRSLARNAETELRDDIYYFSVYGNATTTVGGVTTPQADMEPYLLPFSEPMCRYTGTSGSTWTEGMGNAKRTGSVPSFPLDASWQPNDGAVNLISSRYPFHYEGSARVEDPHTDYTGGSVSPGIWNVFPEQDMDHIDIVGGLLSHIPQVHDLYHDIMTAIAATGSAGTSASGSRHAGCPSANMTDVPESAWFHTFVDYVLEHGLMSGTSATTFSPDATVTRGMVVQTLYAMDGKPAASTTAPFSDVSSGKYYASAVTWAESRGVVSGYADGTFHPDDAITREQLVTMLRAYVSYRGVDVGVQQELSGFADAAAVSDYATGPVQWALAAGLIQGRSDNGHTLIAPQATAMRSELAVMLKNLQEKIL